MTKFFLFGALALLLCSATAHAQTATTAKIGHLSAQALVVALPESATAEVTTNFTLAFRVDTLEFWSTISAFRGTCATRRNTRL